MGLFTKYEAPERGLRRFRLCNGKSHKKYNESRVMLLSPGQAPGQLPLPQTDGNTEI